MWAIYINMQWAAVQLFRKSFSYSKQIKERFPDAFIIAVKEPGYYSS